MSIKKFGESEKTPDQSPNPTEDAVKSSPFSPWLTKGKDKKSPLGEKAWSASGGKNGSGKYTDQNELAEALLVQATNAYKSVEKVVRLYERASRNPTRENVAAYSNAVFAIVEGDNQEGAAIVSVLIATLFSMLGGSGSKR